MKNLRVSCPPRLFEKMCTTYGVQSKDVDRREDGTLVPKNLTGTLFVSLFIVGVYE